MGRQIIDIKLNRNNLLMLNSNTWNHFTVWKQMSSHSFKNDGAYNLLTSKLYNLIKIYNFFRCVSIYCQYCITVLAKDKLIKPKILLPHSFENFESVFLQYCDHRIMYMLAQKLVTILKKKNSATLKIESIWGILHNFFKVIFKSQNKYD